jgi:hypothetical protein
MRALIGMCILLAIPLSSALGQDVMTHVQKVTGAGTRVASCHKGYLANGLDCDGECTLRTLHCKRYPEAGSKRKWTDLVAKDPAVMGGAFVPTFVVGIAETDEQLRLRYPQSTKLVRVEQCEPRSKACRVNFFLTGLQCQDAACVNPDLICCPIGQPVGTQANE